MNDINVSTAFFKVKKTGAEIKLGCNGHFLFLLYILQMHLIDLIVNDSFCNMLQFFFSFSQACSFESPPSGETSDFFNCFFLPLSYNRLQAHIQTLHPINNR